MQITRIEELAQKKRRVYIDDSYAFMLYDKDIAIYSLREGQEISDLLYNKIIKDTVLRRARQKAIAVLERSDRTEAEIRRKLKEGMYTETIIDSVITYLVSLHYLDDLRYAENYVRTRASQTSARELSNKLLQKGVSKDTIALAIASVEEELSFSSQSSGEDALSREQSAAVLALRKKLNGRTSIDYQTRQKLIAYMLRKGYRMNDISTAFDVLEVSFGAEEDSFSTTSFFDLSDNF